MMTVYGIAGCDTVRKARRWLDARGVAYRFHDLRRDGLEGERVRAWLAELGWEQLVNRRATTWRGLPEGQRAAMDEDRALALILEHPTLVRRPVLDLGERRVVGFSPDRYEKLFG